MQRINAIHQYENHFTILYENHNSVVVKGKFEYILWGQSMKESTKILVIGKGESKVHSLSYVSQKYKISQGNIINAILMGTQINGLCFDYALKEEKTDNDFNFDDY